jgi:hypothetical protein
VRVQISQPDTPTGKIITFVFQFYI